MADKSTISDDYKEIDTSSVKSSRIDQVPEIDHPTKDINEQGRLDNEPITDKVSGKVTESLTEAGKEGKIMKSFIWRSKRCGGVKSIILGFLL
jgi:hypothetical protein